tara:strand:- start:977 stop:1390 length:414 start_codon:yes stop_codon:yes gene_type:complete
MRLFYLIFFIIASNTLANNDNNFNLNNEIKHFNNLNEFFIEKQTKKRDKKILTQLSSKFSDVKVAIISVEGMVCDFCARGIEKAFLKDNNVIKVLVDLNNGNVILVFTKSKKIDFEDIKTLIADNGQTVFDINVVLL